ncbi:hypothetical protein OAN96_00185 [Candidatus Gracilibacteria bacterium]|nr:hypothetical protein [Candidatus Gracilibacteria bacterium]
MQKFKISVSKDQKKYTLVLNAQNEIEARDKVHKQGYSILSVSTISDQEITGHQYHFEATLDGEVKRGKVVGEDIFKIYVKLRKDLGYNVTAIFSSTDKDLPVDEKKKILRDLETSYYIHLGIKSDKKSDKQEAPKSNLEGFHMRKDLEETYKLIDFVLKKLEGIMKQYQFYGLDDLGLDKIKNTYNSIVKIKKTTNISKLRETGEKALMKIGSIELRSIERDKNIEQRELLSQTNELLKKIGSNQRFIEQNKDFKKIAARVFGEISASIDSIKQSFRPAKIEKIDKGSYSYIKTKLLKQKYKSRGQENTRNIFKNIIVFILPFGKNKELRDSLVIKKKVISQNISLLDAKLSGKVYSYVKIIKGYKKIVDFILGLFFYIKDSLFLVIFIYSFALLLYLVFQGITGTNIVINFSGLYYFIIAAFIYFVILLSRGVLSLMLNFVFLFFIIIFATVNF